MKILDRYLLRQFIGPYCFSILAFLILYWVLDLFTHLDDFIKNHTSWTILLQYCLTEIPIVLVQISPLASVTAIISSLGRMGKFHELTALRSCGISWFRISLPLLSVGILITLTALLLGDKLIPQAMLITHSIKEEHLERESNQTESVIENVALYGTRNRMFYAKRYDPNEKILYDLIIFIDDNHHHPVAKIVAEKAEWIVNDKWKLYSCLAYQLGDGGEILEKPVYYEERTMDLDETPQSFLKMESQIHFMRYEQLENYIERIAMSGKNVTRRLMVELYSRIAFPFANLALIIIAIPIAILPFQQKKWLFTGISSCVTICLLFYFVNSLLISLGNAGLLPPWLSAWGANLLFAGIGVFLLQKT